MAALVLLLVAVISIGATAIQDVPSICRQIDQHLPGRISYPDGPAYNESQSSYYSGQESDLQPGCIFQPRDTIEVSQFVKLIGGGHGAPASQFAVRSGGHTIWGGAANIDGGITVDLRCLNTLTVSADRKVASIGAGVVWSDIYPQLVPQNLTVMGGRVSGIGVGGFTTGGNPALSRSSPSRYSARVALHQANHQTGGISYLARRHGWACDNVYGYEVVLASGEVVYATAAPSPHADLWLALKGGSNNFGIVTRFDVAAFPQGPMWGASLAFNYTREVLEAQAAAFARFMDPGNFDDAADMGMALVFAGGTYVVGDSLYYTEPVENPAVYRPFTDMSGRISGQSRLDSVAAFVGEVNGTLPADTRR